MPAIGPAPVRIAGSVSAAVAYSATAGATVQPVYGAGYIPQRNDILVWITGERIGTDVLGAQAGWNRCANTNSPQIAVLLRKSDGPVNGAIDPRDLPPSLSWGAQLSWGFCFGVRGALEDVTAVIDVWTDKGGTQVGNIVGTNVLLTPSAANEYCLFVGQKNRTATTNGVTFQPAAGFDGLVIQNSGPNSTPFGPAVAACDWSQTTATAIPINTLMSSGGLNDATGQSMQGIVLFFKPSNLDGNATVVTSDTAALTTQIKAAGAALVSTAAVAALTNWATVTLAAPLYTGIGGILDPHFWVDEAPTVGTQLFYDATYATIYATGEISSTSNNCSFVVMWNDGTQWVVGIVVITPNMVGYADVASAAAGALTTAILLAGAAIVATTENGQISTGIRLAGAAVAVTAATSAMITAIQAAANAFTGTSATGRLTGGTSSLQGNIVIVSQALGSLATKIQAAAQALVNTQATGALGAQVVFSGAANALTQASADLTTAIQMAGNANVVTSAAGAALLTSFIAGAAHMVASGAGQLLTGLLISGNAFVDTEATGDLTTIVTLSGAAIVDTAASLKPVGPEGQFGYATVTVLSRTGLPVARSAFIEHSACIVSISYFNIEGLPFVPNGVGYSISDVVSGEQLLGLTDVGPPGTSNAVTVNAAQNSLVNLTRSFEEHQILFLITDGLGIQNYASAIFDVVRTTGAMLVTNDTPTHPPDA